MKLLFFLLLLEVISTQPSPYQVCTQFSETLNDGSLEACGNIKLSAWSTVQGNECALGKIDHSTSVFVQGNANTNTKFESGQNSFIFGNVVSNGKIETKPDSPWSNSIGGIASEYIAVSDPNCLAFFDECIVKKMEFKKKGNFSTLQNDINVPAGQTFDWLPGIYHKVKFGKGSTITIHVGDYNVLKLDFQNDVTFSFEDISQNCTQGVETKFTIFSKVELEKGFTMSGVFFGCANCSYDSYQVLWQVSGNFHVKSTLSQLFGVVYADNIELGEKVFWNGCLSGSQVELKTQAQLLPYGANNCGQLGTN